MEISIEQIRPELTWHLRQKVLYPAQKLYEMEMDEDQAYDLEMKAILPLLFGKSTPYGHPVIGEREHVRAATAKVIKSHYDRWYYPNNASLVVAGGKIEQVFVVVNPDKLAGLGTPPEGT